MRLTNDEIRRFYNIWFPLLHYVNQKRNITSSFPAVWARGSVDPQEARKIRDVLWADDSLRESFISENPAGLSKDDLSLVDSWKYHLSGDFFIYRYLKKYTVFLLEGKPAQAYGVLGLASDIEEIVGPYLPVYVRAVLIPFDGRIIYDGLLAPYPIFFGGGFRADLNLTYRDIQERGGVISTLIPTVADHAHSIKDIRARNKKLLTAFQKELGRAGLSPKMMEEHTGRIADFAERIMLSRNPPTGLLGVTIEDVQRYVSDFVGQASRVSMKRFIQFLRDTERVDNHQAKPILDYLKSERLH
jgi:hypothetical protein